MKDKVKFLSMIKKAFIVIFLVVTSTYVFYVSCYRNPGNIFSLYSRDPEYRKELLSCQASPALLLVSLIGLTLLGGFLKRRFYFLFTLSLLIASNAYFEANYRERKEEKILSLAAKSGDVKLCEKMYGPFYQKGCYFRIVDNPEYKLGLNKCEELDNRDIKSVCYNDLAKQWQDVKICDKFLSEHWSRTPEFRNRNRGVCLAGVGGASGDPNVCELLPKNKSFLNLRSECFYGVAVTSQDVNMCAKIEPGGQDLVQCYLYFVALTGSKNYCNNIVDDEAKESCLYGSDRPYLLQDILKKPQPRWADMPRHFDF